MAKNVLPDFDTTAGNNLDIASISTAEGWLPSTVNNAVRALLSMHKKDYLDRGGAVTIGGTANAITITSASPASYQTLISGLRLLFRPAADNSGATTLNLDALGAKAVRKIVGSSATDVALVAGDIRNGSRAEIVYDTSLNAAAGGWLLINPAAVQGSRTNDAGAVGQVGETTDSTVASGSAVSLTTNTAADVTSISLTAGDWEVSGNVGWSPGATTSITVLRASISTTTATVDSTTGGAFTGYTTAAIVPGANTLSFRLPVGPLRISVAAPTTVYLVSVATFTISTLAAFGHLHARRLR